MLPVFIPQIPFLPRHVGSKPSHRVLRCCVAPRHVRRANEIKRIAEQLEQLRAARERLANESTSAESPPPHPTSSPIEAAVPASPTAASPTAPTTSAPTPSSAPAPLHRAGPALPVTPGPQPPRPDLILQHATNSRFLSISSVGSDEAMPRILPVIGHVPGLAVSTYTSTPNVSIHGSTDAGNVFVVNSSALNCPIVAVPCTEVLATCKDPVSITISADRLSSSKLPIVENGSVLLIVDRDVTDVKVDSSSFYVWDVDGAIEVGWIQEIPPGDGIRLVGRVSYGISEVDSSLRTTKSGWEEENETYM